MSAALYIVIVAMLLQQAMSYMAALVLPNVAPQAGAALMLDPELVLYHTTLFYAVSGIFQASVGGLIIRWGAIRASQISLLGLGLGLALSMIGTIWAFALAALVMGAANSFSTPASSHLLARWSPRKHAPLIFSIKQTGVPVGGQFAVVAGWLLVQESQPETWVRAFLATAIICLALMVVIHPMRRRFDDDRNPGHPVRFDDAIRNIGAVARTPALRDLALVMVAFVGLQGLFNSIFATYAQTSLGYEKDVALRILFAVNLLAAASRIFWGWLGSGRASPRLVLAMLAFVMAAATVGIGLAGGYPHIVLGLAALAFGASALSWHGLLLSEVARLAPPGQVGPITGGVLFFGALGMLTFPFIAKTLRDVGVDYSTIFVMAALPAALIGVKILFPVKATPRAAESPPRPTTPIPTAEPRTVVAKETSTPRPAAPATWPGVRLTAGELVIRPGLGAALRARRVRR